MITFDESAQPESATGATGAGAEVSDPQCCGQCECCAAWRAELQRAQAERDRFRDNLRVEHEELGRERERAVTAERELARANALLRRLEWALDGGDYCPICQMAEPHHAGDCELDRHLRGDAPAQPATRQPASDDEIYASTGGGIDMPSRAFDRYSDGYRACERRNGITGRGRGRGRARTARRRRGGTMSYCPRPDGGGLRAVMPRDDDQPTADAQGNPPPFEGEMVRLCNDVGRWLAVSANGCLEMWQPLWSRWVTVAADDGIRVLAAALVAERARVEALTARDTAGLRAASVLRWASDELLGVDPRVAYASTPQMVARMLCERFEELTALSQAAVTYHEARDYDSNSSSVREMEITGPLLDAAEAEYERLLAAHPEMVDNARKALLASAERSDAPPAATTNERE